MDDRTNSAWFQEVLAADRIHIDYDETDAITADAARLLREKALNYGPSFKVVAEIMKLLYPSGVPVTTYGDVSLIIRCMDKVCRMAFSQREGEDVWADCVDQEDPWRDIMGYAILALESHQNHKSRGV